MNRFERKAILVIFGAHALVFFWFFVVLLWLSALKGCFQPKPKPEIVTFIEFGEPAPPVAVQEVEQMPEPEPPAPEPAPTPEPVQPAPIPEPEKKTLPKPKTETPKPKPKPKPVEPEKPKWKPTPVNQIKKGQKVEPVKPAIDPTEISKALKSVQSSDALPTVGPVGNPDADAAYITQIGRYFDTRWNEPPNASPASSVIYRIFISQWGSITKRTKIQGSGDSAFDASVAEAVNSVSTAPKPPSGFPYEYVEVEFRIRN